ncbi:rCG21569 [Rattus norvegicus]|uniref:RCG21569 n=1 Tax=Rattus norvegicus TaxID=10116 RepID=A6J1Q8_RAT|nr:rCG21569 [Rattus norvegicus]
MNTNLEETGLKPRVRPLPQTFVGIGKTLRLPCWRPGCYIWF